MQSILGKKFLIPLIFPGLIWIVYLVSALFNLSFVTLGVLPREISGLVGIFFSPLIHENFSHLFSNTLPLIVLGYGVFYFYPHAAYKVILFIYLLTGSLVWLFARTAYHIGASGIVYGFVAFIFFSGLFRRDNKSISLALVVIFLYGGLVWGIFPGQENISWESHAFGALSGIISAFIYRKIDPPKKYDWEDEEDKVDPRSLEVSYDPEKNKFDL